MMCCQIVFEKQSRLKGQAQETKDRPGNQTFVGHGF
jgi:hypothetical protein